MNTNCETRASCDWGEREREKKNERRSDSIFIVPLLWKRFHNRVNLIGFSPFGSRWMEFKGAPVSATRTNDSDPNRYSPIRIEGRQCRQAMTAIPLPRKQRIIRESSSVRFSVKWRVGFTLLNFKHFRIYISIRVYIDIKSAQLVFKWNPM